MAPGVTNSRRPLSPNTGSQRNGLLKDIDTAPISDQKRRRKKKSPQFRQRDGKPNTGDPEERRQQKQSGHEKQKRPGERNDRRNQPV